MTGDARRIAIGPDVCPLGRHVWVRIYPAGTTTNDLYEWKCRKCGARL